MNLDRIQLTLQTLLKDDRRWAHQGRRLVFWYDEQAEFAEEIQRLVLPGAKVAVIGDTPFALKRQLLIEDPQTPYLLYSPHPKPEDAQWNEPLGQDHRPSHFALVSRYADHTAKEPRCQDATTPAISNLRWWARSMLACPPPLSSAENIHSPPA